MTLALLTEFRQSTLRAFEVCPRRTRFALETGELKTGWTGSSTNLGTLVHSFAQRYVDTLATPEFRPAKTMPTEEAVNIAREVYSESPFVLDGDDFDSLMGMAVRFTEFDVDVNRVLFMEDQLRAEILCPDGEIRVLTGTPDLVLADPPEGVEIRDYKSGMGQPRSPKKAEPDGEPLEGKQYLSDVGKAQRRIYGLLVMLTLPSVRYARMWELPLRFRKHGPRFARLERSQLEHVTPWVGANMMKLDAACREGSASPLWEPRPGSQCFHCEVARSCPVPPGLRGVGAVEDQVAADVEARRYVRGKAMYEQAAERLKARQAEGLPPGRVNGREEARWGPETDAWQTKGGGRSFKVWPRVDVVNDESEVPSP